MTAIGRQFTRQKTKAVWHAWLYFQLYWSGGGETRKKQHI